MDNKRLLLNVGASAAAGAAVAGVYQGIRYLMQDQKSKSWPSAGGDIQPWHGAIAGGVAALVTETLMVTNDGLLKFTVSLVQTSNSVFGLATDATSAAGTSANSVRVSLNSAATAISKLHRRFLKVFENMDFADFNLRGTNKAEFEAALLSVTIDYDYLKNFKDAKYQRFVNATKAMRDYVGNLLKNTSGVLFNATNIQEYTEESQTADQFKAIQAEYSSSFQEIYQAEKDNNVKSELAVAHTNMTMLLTMEQSVLGVILNLIADNLVVTAAATVGLIAAGWVVYKLLNVAIPVFSQLAVNAMRLLGLPV